MQATHSRKMTQGNQLITQITQCRLCDGKIPYAPKPIFQYSSKSKIIIAGQAPGDKTHQQGKPFDDKSGDRLREWLGVSKASFYNSNYFAHLPMAFCFPGSGKSGDLPPPKICAQTWRQALFEQLECAELILILGKYSLDWHRPSHRGNLTQAIQANDFSKQSILLQASPLQTSSLQASSITTIVLPHPSPRNNLWLKKNPWFDEQLIELKRKVGGILNAT